MSDRPTLGQVRGAVLFEGKPLAGASVTFEPVDGRPAFGKTNQDGQYELIYIRDIRGCKVGENKVSIVTVGEGLDDDAEIEADRHVQFAAKPVREVLPARYHSSTELIADVKPGKNTIDFQLSR